MTLFNSYNSNNNFESLAIFTIIFSLLQYIVIVDFHYFYLKTESYCIKQHYAKKMCILKFIL